MSGWCSRSSDRRPTKRGEICDRLTSPMIADYCAALGLHPFEENFYGRRALLLEHPGEFLPPYSHRLTMVRMSVAEVQVEIGILPGETAGQPGCSSSSTACAECP